MSTRALATRSSRELTHFAVLGELSPELALPALVLTGKIGIAVSKFNTVASDLQMGCLVAIREELVIQLLRNPNFGAGLFRNYVNFAKKIGHTEIALGLLVEHQLLADLIYHGQGAAALDWLRKVPDCPKKRDLLTKSQPLYGNVDLLAGVNFGLIAAAASSGDIKTAIGLFDLAIAQSTVPMLLQSGLLITTLFHSATAPCDITKLVKHVMGWCKTIDQECLRNPEENQSSIAEIRNLKSRSPGAKELDELPLTQLVYFINPRQLGFTSLPAFDLLKSLANGGQRAAIDYFAKGLSGLSKPLKKKLLPSITGPSEREIALAIKAIKSAGRKTFFPKDDLERPAGTEPPANESWRPNGEFGRTVLGLITGINRLTGDAIELPKSKARNLALLFTEIAEVRAFLSGFNAAYGEIAGNQRVGVPIKNASAPEAFFFGEEQMSLAQFFSRALDLWELPKARTSWNREYWRARVLEHPPLVHVLAIAPEIESAILSRTGKLPNSWQDLRSELLTYAVDAVGTTLKSEDSVWMKFQMGLENLVPARRFAQVVVGAELKVVTTLLDRLKIRDGATAPRFTPLIAGEIADEENTPQMNRIVDILTLIGALPGIERYENPRTGESTLYLDTSDPELLRSLDIALSISAENERNEILFDLTHYSLTLDDSGGTRVERDEEEHIKGLCKKLEIARGDFHKDGRKITISDSKLQSIADSPKKGQLGVSNSEIAPALIRRIDEVVGVLVGEFSLGTPNRQADK